MKAQNMTTSIHARLLNIAKATHKPFSELLQYYAIERFLYRLSQSPYQAQFVLKGALIFVAWGAPRSRSTRDIDLLGYGSSQLEQLMAIIKTICITEVINDGLAFDSDSIRGEQIRERANYEGVRVKLTAKLGDTRIPMQIDVGFGDAVIPAPIFVEYPALLDLPMPKLRGYTKETVIAEKYHALVILGQFNSRMKDFYDLWVLAHHFEFDGQLLYEAISKTFQRRATPLPTTLPVGLIDNFAIEKEQQWQAFKQRIQVMEDVPELATMLQVLRPFLTLTQMPNHYWYQGQWQAAPNPFTKLGDI